eukprot:TRINITY_DN55338_c0_g1_i1.p1 TRINITY_DN55338_c0_g1~~TRINITY_DN55338_c0_g1_i1.p1  ORF type:complete len:522 (+),score=129.16 TRINITY_DN55338_c0_g1_i1:75-1568(+)
MLQRTLPRLLYGAGNSLTVRLRMSNQPGTLHHVLRVIAELEGHVGAIDLVRHEGQQHTVTRDISIDARDVDHQHEILHALQTVEGARVKHWSDRTFLLHLGGKLEVGLKFPVRTRDDYSMAYTPGVGRVCLAIHENPDKARNLTIKKNTVAVVSDGSSVLALGDLGPEGAMPVIEGLCMLFKEFGHVDAFPICVGTNDPAEIVSTVRNISPTFGGICIEDISAPRCFEIERALRQELDIPVFHDDQHGTAIVVTAALLNCFKLQKRTPGKVKVVVAGTGASGVGCTHMLRALGVTNIVGVDTEGAIYSGRAGLSPHKAEYAALTNRSRFQGSLSEALKGADVFIGLAGPGIVSRDDIRGMAPDPIVFALGNPAPEISPQDALEGGAAIVASSRADWPNQLCNVLAFPGVFRGALDVAASEITEGMKLAAARALASCVPEEALSTEYVVPSAFDRQVCRTVARAVAEAAQESGVARAVFGDHAPGGAGRDSMTDPQHD